MESTLINLLKSIVKFPDDISIDKEEPHMGLVIFHIHANEEDKGLIIGKHGKNIKALGDIIGIKALKENKKSVLKIS